MFLLCVQIPSFKIEIPLFDFGINGVDYVNKQIRMKCLPSVQCLLLFDGCLINDKYAYDHSTTSLLRQFGARLLCTE